MKGKKLIYGHIQFSSVVITNSYGNAFWGTVRINIPASFGISNFHAVTATVHSDFGLLTCSVKWIEKNYIEFYIISPLSETRDLSLSLLALAW